MYMAKKFEFKPDKPRSGLMDKLYLTQIQRKNLLKWVLYVAVLLVLSLLQDVVFSKFHLFGATTELVPCGIFLICLMEGTESGSVFALLASCAYLFSGSAAGNYSLVLLTVISFLKHIKIIPTSRPLHLPFPLRGTFFHFWTELTSLF